MTHIGDCTPDRFEQRRASGAYDDSDNHAGDDLGLTADPATTRAIITTRRRAAYRSTFWVTIALLLCILLFVLARAVFSF